MGKRVIRFLCVCLLCSMSVMTVAAGQVRDTEENVSIEQVYLNMPELTVYGYGLNRPEAQPEAYLGTEKLQMVSAMPFAESGEGINYYILLDVSNSMPNAYFSRIKDGIAAFSTQLSDRDQATLITFGETVKVETVLTRNTEAIVPVLAAIQNKDNRTMLFEAVSQAADMAVKDSFDGGKRQVIIVISDGEDVAEGKKVAQEALLELKEKAIPVYALCIADTARININSFGEFARMSGGNIVIFGSDEAAQSLAGVRYTLMSADVLELRAAGNKISNQYEQFSLHIPEWQIPLNREVLSCRFIPDQNIPVIQSAEQLAGRQIKITFNKVVTGDETASNYLFKNDQAVIPIAGVARSEEEDNTVIITAAEPFDAGEYTISCVNITDVSQEAHPVTAPISLALEASDPQEPQMSMVSLAGFVFLAFVIMMITMIIVYNKIKKNKTVIVVDDKKILAGEVEVKQHVSIASPERKQFDLLVTVAGKNPHKLELSIDRSLIVGRSNICDLYFDDVRMSRQHFVLEWDGRDMYISDLNTTNGTSVNGVNIRNKRRLEKGDRITAGAEELTINW